MNNQSTLVATGEPLRPGRKPGRWRWIGVALLLAAGLVLAACSPATIARVFGFQGRLTDSAGNPVSATKVMTFTLWTDDNAGSVVFTETQTVAVSNGLFNVFIGNATLGAAGQYERSGVDPENFAVPLFVQVEVDGETLSPRTRLGSAPTSMGLVGGAVIISNHEGNGGLGAIDTTTSAYASLTVLASSTVSGTALIVGHAAGNNGDYIRACGNITTSTRSCPDAEFEVKAGGDVYIDGTYFCGANIDNGAGLLDETEIEPCLTDSAPADFAEYLQASPHLEAGDVLVINANGVLERSTKAYQATVLGVYSTRPSYIGNARFANDESYAPLAVSGIVPVKVSGAVTAGDMLVASNVPGRAMRGKNPAAGTVIGKALESSSGKTGVILMLVMSR